VVFEPIGNDVLEVVIVDVSQVAGATDNRVNVKRRATLDCRVQVKYP
jgi:hypothetical protein